MNITANVIAPGMFETDSNSQFLSQLEIPKGIEEQTVLRGIGEVPDIANLSGQYIAAVGGVRL